MYPIYTFNIPSKKKKKEGKPKNTASQNRKRKPRREHKMLVEWMVKRLAAKWLEIGKRGD